MRHGLVSETFSLRTQWEAEDVRAALQASGWIQVIAPKGGHQADPEWKLWVMIGPGRNSWRPRWRCTFTEEGAGTRLTVRAGCSWFARIFMIVWFGILAFDTALGLAAAAAEGRWSLLLICAAFWAFGLGLSGLCFWLPERRAKARLCQMLSGELE